MTNEHPKVFVSYSWTTPEHEAFVMELAESLVDSGVDIIIDKWNLRNGQDSYAFMESMVNDNSISKVLIISDRAYADKANGRKGGVGTETQIISPEIYNSADQTRFVVVVTEKDEKGQFIVPTFYKGRIHINMTDSSYHSDGVEQILRWIYDKPLHVKPEIGKRPSFLDETPELSLGTSIFYTRALDAVRGGKTTALGCFDEYLTVLSTNLERLRFHINEHDELDEAFLKNIASFLPARNEFVSLLDLVCRFSLNEDFMKRLHGFFEVSLAYYYPPERANSYNQRDFDNYKFIIHEIYLYSVAILLKHEKFKECSILFDDYYVTASISQSNEPLQSYTTIREHVGILEYRNKHRELRRLSLHADILKERCHSLPVNFTDINQADFVCYLRSLVKDKNTYQMWWPVTMLYARGYFPFPVFAKSTSESYFNKFKLVISVESAGEFLVFIKQLSESDRIPRWQFESFSPLLLSNAENISKQK